MAERELRFPIIAEDKASKTLDKIEDKTEKLEKDKVQIPVEVNDRASGPLGRLQGVFDKLKGSLGSIPGPLGGVADALGSLGVAGGAVGGLTAIAAGAVKAATAFTDLALKAANFGRTSGLGVEEASRWIAVADDIGVSSESIAKAIDKMQKSVGTGVLDKLGLSAAKGKDATETFLNIARAIQAIPDETEQAAIASQIFGKSWGEVSELILGNVDDIQRALADVSDAQLISPEEQKKAEDFRKATDDLHDSFSDLALQVGEIVVPVLSNLAETIAKVVTPFSSLIERMREFDDTVNDIPGLGQLNQGLSDLLDFDVRNVPIFDTIGSFFDIFDDGPKKVEQGFDIAGRAAAGFIDDIKPVVNVEADLAKQTELTKKAQEDAAKAVDTYLTAMQKLRDETEKQVAAQRSLADINRELPSLLQEQTDAINAIGTAQAKANEEAAKAAKAPGNKEQAQAAKDAADAVVEAGQKAIDTNIKVADSLVKQAELQAKASGQTLDASKSQEIWNASMLESASRLSGPLQKSVLNYIADVNKIPPEKVSEIEALIAQGKLDEAKRKLNEASATRTASMQAEATNVGPTEQTLNHLARDRQVDIEAQINVSGMAAFEAALARAQAGGLSAPSGPAPAPHSVIINLPAGSDGREVVAAQRRFMRRNGGV